jgi:predicted metalloprotease
MRTLIFGGVAALLLLTGCAPVYNVTADSSGQISSDFRRTPQDERSQPSPPAHSGQTESAYPTKEFVARIVGDTEDVWTALFESMGMRYEPPMVVLFTRSTASGCGIARAATGPFYCSADRTVYLDTAFFSELPGRSYAPGDFARAYLIVREISHHVQNALGTVQQFEPPPSEMVERQRNQLQVRLELQADCYTGVWAFFVQKRNLLEPGDLEEVRTVQGLGDASTRGTAEQRLWWFKHGLATGDPRQCDTLKASQP